MTKRYRVTLKSAMIIVAATLMVCTFSCSKKSDSTSMEKMNQSGTKAGDSLNKTVKEKSDKATEAVFTCSMHPQIKMPKKGKCPICSMDLILVTDNK